MAQVGQPQMKIARGFEATARRAGCSCRCRSPKGSATRSASFNFDGNTVVKSEALRPLFKLEQGETYSEKKIKKGLEKAQEVYGVGGYFEFTAYPTSKPRDHAGRGRRVRRSARARGTAVTRTVREGQRQKDEAARRRRDDAGGRRQAVLRQPHHVHRQHDDARQRHPPRDPAARGRRLQHRGAQGQRPPHQPARLLQAARRARRSTCRRPPTPTTRSTSS